MASLPPVSARKGSPSATRKSTLSKIYRQLASDERRSKASTALSQSLDARLLGSSSGFKGFHSTALSPSLPQIHESGVSDASPASCGAGSLPPLRLASPPEAEPESPQSVCFSDSHTAALVSCSIASSSPKKAQRQKSEGEALEGAYRGFVRSFETDGRSFGVEELANFLAAFGILDEWLTAAVVRDYFRGVVKGTGSEHYGGAVREAADTTRISSSHFHAFLRFAADMKGAPYEEVKEEVLGHLQMNSDQSTSMTWRLELVFAAFGKQVPGRIVAIEFAQLLRATGLISFQGGRLTVGDVIDMFDDYGGSAGIDYQGFTTILAEVGRRIGIGRVVNNRIAEAVENLDNDEFVVVRMRLSLKDAATTLGIVNMSQLFRALDPDGSGQLSWAEFLHMCRNKFQITTKDWDLKLLFRKLDRDHSGELDIRELVSFIGEGVQDEEDDLACLS